MPDRRGKPSSPDIVIITGLSGSGMTSAINAFEDLGYFCVDNMPLMLLPTFARLVRASDEERGRIDRAALVVSFREGRFLADFAKQLRQLRKQGLTTSVLFFEASDEILARRFRETRRPHPAERGKGLPGAIRTERETMKALRSLADEVIDTSDHTVHSVRKFLLDRFSPRGEAVRMRVQVLSFGHRFGTPREMELLFDVRHLPNPFFIDGLRGLTGADRRVLKYLKAQPEVEETLNRFSDLLLYLLPQYQREGKSYLTVGVGCTGGRHRSVMIANELTQRLRKAGFDAHAVHRDMRKAVTQRQTLPGETRTEKQNMKVIEADKPKAEPRRMIGGVIVTQGHLASEFIAAAEMIVGPMPHVTPASIDWHDDVDVARAELGRAIARVSNGRGVLLLTDIFGGAPTHIASMFLDDNDVEIITGVNLPMILKLADQSMDEPLVNVAQRIRDAGKDGIHLAGEILAPPRKTD